MLMRSGEPPASVTLPLLCALGYHKTDGLARWNAGYYFARCTRCRRDLVRTAFTRWQIPRGFRVVWQNDGPQAHGGEAARYGAPAGQVEFPLRDVPPVVPVAEPDRNAPDAAAAAAPRPDEQVLQDEPASSDQSEAAADMSADSPPWFDRDDGFEDDVRFDADDRMADYSQDAELMPEAEPEALDEVPVQTPPEPEPPAQPPVASKYPVVPDFMEEGPAGVGWEVVSGHIVPRGQSAEPLPEIRETDARDVPTGLLSQGWQDLVRKRAQKSGRQGREWLRGRRTQARQAARDDVPEPAVAEVDAPAVLPNGVVPAVTVTEKAPVTSGIDDAPIATDNPRITVSDDPLPAGDAPPMRGPDIASSTPRPAATGVLRDMLVQHSPFLAAVVFGALVFAAAVVDGRNSGPRIVYRDAPATPSAGEAATTPTARSGAARPGAPAWVPVPSDVAYVTAGLLNCRATPSNEAETLRRLSRGATVRVLGATPGWFSVAHQGRQCWVAAQHVSRVRPA